MKHISKIILSMLSVLFIASWVSCKEDSSHGEGEGSLSMKMNISLPVMGETIMRGEENNTDFLGDSCRVRVYNEKGLIRFYKGIQNIPSVLWLQAGDYRITAVTGDSVAATFKNGYYKGETNVTITAGESSNAVVTCKLMNTLVNVDYTDALKAVLSDCKVIVGSSKGELEFAGSTNDSIGYFMLPKNETSLQWTIMGTRENGTIYEQSGTLPNVKGGYQYTLKFDFNESEFNMGGAYFKLIVDESVVEKVDNIVITKRPDIVGNGFDIKDTHFFEYEKGEELSVWVNASSAISQLVVSCEAFTSLGMPANSLDFFALSSATIATWEGLGISHRYEYDSANDNSTAKITFAESFVRSLPEGDYKINIRVADMHAKEWNETLSISISNAVVLTENPIRSDIWSSKAILRGRLLRETTDEIFFSYREKNSSTWTTIPANLSEENLLTAQLTGLEAGKTYEYYVSAGAMKSAVTVEFTTESKFILPNAGFEEFHQPGKVLLIYGEGGSMWWDSGNHGSSTMNINITTQDFDIKHSGNSSIKMKSQFVGIATVGKFAAGNVFAGVYAGTDGTDGIIDMGRPFNTRPSQFKGYYRYETGAVDYSSTDLLPKGTNDIGSIFVAIGDWDAPFTVRTKESNRTLFDPNDPHIIAYGELNRDSNTEGDGMVPFTINLDYRATDRIPTYIIIVASASKYGDYFSGSSKSTMWLDDLELVYE